MQHKHMFRVILGALAVLAISAPTASACTQTTVQGHVHLGANSASFGVYACTTQTNGSLGATEESTTTSPWKGGWLMNMGGALFAFRVEPAGPITGSVQAHEQNTKGEELGPFTGTVNVPAAVEWEPWAALHIRCTIVGFALKGALEGPSRESLTGSLTTEAFSPAKVAASSTCPGVIAWLLNELVLQLHPGSPESASAAIEVGSGAKPL